jgi:hypothetical protein
MWRAQGISPQGGAILNGAGLPQRYRNVAVHRSLSPVGCNRGERSKASALWRCKGVAGKRGAMPQPPAALAHWSNGRNALSSQQWATTCSAGISPVTGETKFKRLELAIANYNTMIHTLKNQMQGEAAANSLVTRQAIAQYQRGRAVLDVSLGLERIA